MGGAGASGGQSVGGGGSGGQSVGGGGASGGAGGAGGGVGGAGGRELPCGIDCSTIVTDACEIGACDEDSGVCVVEDAPDGAPCDDGLFCTVDDACEAGTCVGGAANDCGMEPTPCEELSCNESAQQCELTMLADDTPCQGADMCVVDEVCTAGLCGGGQPRDCFTLQLPNSCHVPSCDPTIGCTVEPGNEWHPCFEACKTNGNCTGGVCFGGTDITACMHNDGCCPAGCDVSEDNDC